MKKFFLYSVFLFLGIAIVSFAWIKPELEKKIDQMIRQMSHQKLEPLGIFFDYEKLKWKISWPISIEMQNIKWSLQNQASGQIQSVLTEVQLLDPSVWKAFLNKKGFPEIKISILQPEIKLNRPQMPSPKKENTSTESSAATLPFSGIDQLPQIVPYISNLKISLKVLDLKVFIDAKNEMATSNATAIKNETATSALVSLKKLNFELPDLSSPAALSFSGLIQDLPISFNSKIKFVNSSLTFHDGRFSILNLESSFQGQYGFDRKYFQLNSKCSLPDLSQIPMKEGLQELKSWKGQLETEFQILGFVDDLTMKGQVHLKNVGLNLDVNKPKFHLKGPTYFDLDSLFQIHMKKIETPAVSISNFVLKTQLSESELLVPNLFHKKPGQQLDLSLKASLTEVLSIENLKLRLAQLQLSSNGQLKIAQMIKSSSSSQSLPAEIKIELLPTDLQGLEKIFLPLSQAPLTGDAALKAQFNGDLNNIQSADLHIESLRLNNVQTQIHFQNENIKVDGPLSLQLLAQLQIKNKDVKSGNIQGQIDGRDLDLSFKKMFYKKSHEPLIFKISAQKKNSKLEILSSSLSLAAGQIQIKGTPPLSLESPFDLTVQTEGFQIDSLRKNYPLGQDFLPEGKLSLKTHLWGTLNSADYFSSPLNSQTDLKLNLKKISLPALNTKEKTQSPKPEPSQPAPAPAFLKPLEVLKRAQVKAQINLNELEMLPLRASEITLLSDLQGGKLSGQAKIKKVFDGAVSVSQLRLDLFEENPWVQLQAKADQIRIEEICAWILPDFAKLAKGSTILDLQGKTKLPGTPDFLKNMKFQGGLLIKSGELSTLGLADLLKDKLSKIPGYKAEMLQNRGPLQAQIKSQFTLDQGSLNLSPLQAITPRQEELNVSGTLGLDLKLNLKGSLFLVEIGSGSFFEANKDKLGRVEFPLKIQGSALKPEASMAEETISTMVNKTIEFEKKKLVQKAEQGARSQIQKELEKKKEQLGDDVKKKLQDFFK